MFTHVKCSDRTQWRFSTDVKCSDRTRWRFCTDVKCSDRARWRFCTDVKPNGGSVLTTALTELPCSSNCRILMAVSASNFLISNSLQSWNSRSHSSFSSWRRDNWSFNQASVLDLGADSTKMDQTVVELVAFLQAYCSAQEQSNHLVAHWPPPPENQSELWMVVQLLHRQGCQQQFNW